jgi:DNA primase
VHLARLVELEYVIAHRGLRGLTHEYELRYDGVDDGRPHLMGLLDLQTLDNDADRSGQNDERSGSGRHLVGHRSGMANQVQSETAQGEDGEPVGVSANAYIGENTRAPSLARVVEGGSHG